MASVSVSTTPTRLVPVTATVVPSKQLRAAVGTTPAVSTVIHPRNAAAAGPTVITRGVKRAAPLSEASALTAASPAVLETSPVNSSKSASRQIIVPARLLPTPNSRATVSPVIVTVPSRQQHLQLQLPLEFDSTTSLNAAAVAEVTAPVHVSAAAVAPATPRSLSAAPTVVVRAGAQSKPSSLSLASQPFYQSVSPIWPMPLADQSGVAGLEASAAIPEQQAFLLGTDTAEATAPTFDQLDTSATVANPGTLPAADPTMKLDDSYSKYIYNL